MGHIPLSLSRCLVTPCQLACLVADVQDKLTARNQEVVKMLKLACTRAKVGAEPATAALMRIDLRESAILDVANHGGGEPALADVAEE